MEEETKKRESSQKLKVVLNGKTIFYSISKKTYLEALKNIGIDKLLHINLEIGHLPIISKEIYPKYAKYMEPIGNGYYVNTLGNTSNKYIQLKSIASQLGLDMQVLLVSEQKGKVTRRESFTVDKIYVYLPNNIVINEETPNLTFIECIKKVSVSKVEKLGLKTGSNDLIVASKDVNSHRLQVEIEKGKWVNMPGNLKDKVKILKVIGILLHTDWIVEYSSVTLKNNEGRYDIKSYEISNYPFEKISSDKSLYTNGNKGKAG